MDVKSVVVIIDTGRFTKDEVVKDIKEEGYAYNFFFANFHEVAKAKYAIEHADEVWTWGDCTEQLFYKFAREVGADIWTMRR